MIAKVTGAPGREGEPLGNYKAGVQSGMAKRKDTFLFPDTANGRTTICHAGTDSTTDIQVWQDGPNGQPGHYVQMSEPYPAFQDPPCEYGQGDNPTQPSSDPQTPQRCQTFCDWLNTFTYKDCRAFDPVYASDSSSSDAGNSPSAPTSMCDTATPPAGMHLIGCTCKTLDYKNTCSRQWKTPDANQQDYPNCRVCTGTECRCPGSGCILSPPGAPQGSVYASFFRNYDVTTTRGTLSDVQKDQLASVHSPVACYGFYKEFDPKTEVVGDRRMCVINFPYAAEDENQFTQSPIGLKQSQQGKGIYQLSDAENSSADLPRIRRDATFDANTTLWYQNLGGAISFLSEPSFGSQYGHDLSATFLHPDTAAEQATVQISHDQPLALGNTQRATGDDVTDETGDSRFFVRWWQQFLTDIHQLLSPPTVRLRLPGNLVSIESDLPLESNASSNAAAYPPSQSIEIQLQAKDDLLGTLAGVLQKFLQVKTQPIPVVVPLGSPLSYSAAAQQWLDYENQRAARGLAYPKEQIDALIARLNDYAIHIDQYRTMHDELPRYLSLLVQHQQDIFTGINAWVAQNLDRYRAFLANRQSRLALADKAQAVQTAYASFHDATNFSWCRADNFTLPIYSLLDPWLPGRPLLDGGIPTCDGDGGLPLLCLPKDRDLVLDLTNLRLTRGTLTVPVPHMVPLLFQIPSPPPAQGTAMSAAETPVLPELPPVPHFSTALFDQVPIVETQSTPHSLEAPVPFDPTSASHALDRALTILQGMTTAYRQFWDGIEPSQETKDLACATGPGSKCVYVESELLQIFTRLVARPAIQLKEDLQTVGPATAAICDAADNTCSKPTAQRTDQSDGWQIIVPPDGEAGTSQTDFLRTDARRETVTDQGQIRISTTTNKPYPYDSATQDIYRIFEQPSDLPLSPPAP